MQVVKEYKNQNKNNDIYLPVEIWGKVFEWMSVAELSRIRSCCFLFYDLANMNLKSLFQREIKKEKNQLGYICDLLSGWSWTVGKKACIMFLKAQICFEYWITHVQFTEDLFKSMFNDFLDKRFENPEVKLDRASYFKVQILSFFDTIKPESQNDIGANNIKLLNKFLLAGINYNFYSIRKKCVLQIEEKIKSFQVTKQLTDQPNKEVNKAIISYISLEPNNNDIFLRKIWGKVFEEMSVVELRRIKSCCMLFHEIATMNIKFLYQRRVQMQKNQLIFICDLFSDFSYGTLKERCVKFLKAQICFEYWITSKELTDDVFKSMLNDLTGKGYLENKRTEGIEKYYKVQILSFCDTLKPLALNEVGTNNIQLLNGLLRNEINNDFNFSKNFYLMTKARIFEVEKEIEKTKIRKELTDQSNNEINKAIIPCRPIEPRNEEEIAPFNLVDQPTQEKYIRYYFFTLLFIIGLLKLCY